MEEATSEEPQRRPRRKKRKKRVEGFEREPPPKPVERTSPRTIRTLVMVAGAATIVGIALVGTHESVAGAFLVIGGMLLLLGSIHKLGRLGPDTPRRASSTGQSQRNAA